MDRIYYASSDVLDGSANVYDRLADLRSRDTDVCADYPSIRDRYPHNRQRCAPVPRSRRRFEASKAYRFAGVEYANAGDEHSSACSHGCFRADHRTFL